MTELLERRIAQIVRDFLEAGSLLRALREHLEAGDLEFNWVERLVGESEEAALYRLKEECHALFRFDKDPSPDALQAEELFDLAVGALFHEGMKFREGFYLTHTYGRRLERLVDAGTAPQQLAESFRRVFESGRHRMLEALGETNELFDETRDQLLILLRQFPKSGIVARTLVERQPLVETVFGEAVSTLLERVYGSEENGYRLAIESVMRSGHFDVLLQLLESEPVRSQLPELVGCVDFARGMGAYYAGDAKAALRGLEAWAKGTAPRPPEWREAAAGVLDRIADGLDTAEPALSRKAGSLRTRMG